MAGAGPNGCSLNVQSFSFLHANLFPIPSLQVERDEYCVQVLKARQSEGVLTNCEISKDVTTYKPSGHDLSASVVTAGFPCQAGK